MLPVKVVASTKYKLVHNLQDNQSTRPAVIKCTKGIMRGGKATHLRKLGGTRQSQLVHVFRAVGLSALEDGFLVAGGGITTPVCVCVCVCVSVSVRVIKTRKTYYFRK